MVDTSVSIATRVSTGTVSSTCASPVSSTTCEWKDKEDSAEMFVQDVEDYTIGFQHGYSNPEQPEIKKANAGALGMMEGKLVKEELIDGTLETTTIRSWPEDRIIARQTQNTDRMFDIITVKDLLVACGLLNIDGAVDAEAGLFGLDTPSSMTGSKKESLRSAGMQVCRPQAGMQCNN